MTDDQWTSCTDLGSMLEPLLNRASDRKLRLFAVACCRRVWHLMTDPRHCNVVEAAERSADGLLGEGEFQEAMQPVVALWAELPPYREVRWDPCHYMTGATRHLETGGGAPYAASYAARGLACLAGPEESREWLAVRQSEEAAQCKLIRDLFGNPSVPFQFDPRWLSGEGSVAVEQAREVYRQGRFESLSLLAGVLERAGCRDRAVLEHCRGPGPHVRGCWVVDALLGHETAVRMGLVSEADWRTCGDPEPLLHFLRDKGSRRKWRLFAVACCRRIGHLITDERSRRAVEVAEQYADDAATSEELEAARSAAQEAVKEAKDVEYVAEAEANFIVTPEYAVTCCRLYAAKAARSAVCRDPRMTDAEPDSVDAMYWKPSNTLAAIAVSQNVYANFGSAHGDARWEEAQRAAKSARVAELQAHCDLLRDLFGEYLGPPGEEGRWLPWGVERGVHPTSQAEQWCLLPRARNLVVRREWLAWNTGTIPRLAEAIYEEQAFDRLPILADALEDAGCSEGQLLVHLRTPGVHVRGCWVIDLLLNKE
jgi:hypothetical protein